MYCIQCGARLADGERQCPLCGTLVFHPQIPMPEGERQYPAGRFPAAESRPWGALFAVTFLALLAAGICLLCDLQLNGRVIWSGYAAGGVLTAYVLAVLPCWFRRPNPVIFVPAGFCAVGLYLLYIDLANQGGWFLSFAFPVTGGLGLLTTAEVALLRYVPKGKLYTLGGGCIALGAFFLLVEFLMNLTFHISKMTFWSLYPLTVLGLCGLAILVAALCRPLREALQRRFFL